MLNLKSVSTSRNKGFSCKESLKDTSQLSKTSCPPARISSFFENSFPLIPVIDSTSRKISLIKKTPFPLDRRSVSTSRIKDLLKNAFPLYGKVASILKNLKISENMEKTGVHQQEDISSLKIGFSQVLIIVSTSRKNSEKNNTVSNRQKNRFH